MSKAKRSGDPRFMRKALALAAKGRTSPNPQVGAVVVHPRSGVILGQGYHKACGQAHAEVVAMAEAGSRCRGADLYVTLEPCNHHGRTPPCSEAVIAAAIKRVFVGCLDPDPKVSGRGVARLESAGIQVIQGLEPERCAQAYEAYTVHRTLGRCHVTLKAAMSLDGRVATRLGHSKWITGEKARGAVHRLRDRMDAILVGVGTVKADDPSLTTRLPRGRGRDPLRIIVDSKARTPRNAKVLRQQSDAMTIIAHTRAGSKNAKALSGPGVETLTCHSVRGRVDLAHLMEQLAGRGIVSLLAEGGGEIHGSLLEAGLVDRAMLFVAPVLIGGTGAVPVIGGKGAARMSEAWRFEQMRQRRYGQDLLLTGKISRS